MAQTRAPSRARTRRVLFKVRRRLSKRLAAADGVDGCQAVLDDRDVTRDDQIDRLLAREVK